MMKKTFGLIMISVLLFTGCAKQEETIPTLVEPVIAEYDTAEVIRDDFYKLETYDGKIFPAIHELYFESDGKIEEVNAYLGDTVHKGDIILSMEYEQLEERLANEMEALENTKRKYNYENTITDLDIEIAKLNLEKKVNENGSDMEITRLQAELEKLQMKKRHSQETQQYNLELQEKKIKDLKENLEKRHLRANTDGEIAYINYGSEGINISAHETAVILAEKGTFFVQCSFISQAMIRSADEVYAVMDGKEYELEYIPLDSADAEKLKNGKKIESQFRIQADENVQIGDYICIYLKSQLKKDVLIIPKKALFKEAGTQFVYIVKDGQLIKTDVVVGTEMDTQVEIKSGLQEGDVVYVKG